MWKYEERDNLGDLSIDGGSVISLIFRQIGCECVAQGMAEW
jgi:hypothetical protein